MYSTGDPPALSMLQQVANGSPAAFERLYDRFAGETYETCRRFAKNDGDADRSMFDLWIGIWTDADALSCEDAVTSAVLRAAALRQLWATAMGVAA